jgi:hypothetical protein
MVDADVSKKEKVGRKRAGSGARFRWHMILESFKAEKSDIQIQKCRKSGTVLKYGGIQ